MSQVSFFPPPQDGMRTCLNRGEAELRALLRGHTQVAPRASIVRMGDKGGRVQLLRSGWAARLRYLPDGGTQICAILLPGDLIGADVLIVDGQTDEVVALTACALDHCEPETIWSAANRQPDLAARLMWHYCEDARRLRNWVIAMGHGDAEQRVALLLLDLRARLILAGELTPDRPDLPFPLTQQVIADTLGLTAVHVNRVLKKLREDGIAWIRGARANVEVRPLAALAAPLLDAHEKHAPAFGLA